MATVSRYNQKEPITQGTAATNLSLEDKIPLQHTTGDNADKYTELSVIKALPYGECTTAAGTQIKAVVLKNYPATFNPVVGTEIVVKFTNANTNAAQMKLKVGSITEVCTCRGIPMSAGSVRAGAVLRFTYIGTSFDCQFAEPLSVIDTASTSPVNSSAVDDLVSRKNYTLTLTGDGAGLIEQTVYNTSVIKVGDVYLCTFNILCGEITESKVAFFLTSVLNSANYRGEGSMTASDGKNYALSSLGNKNVWIYSNGERIRTNVFSGQRLKGFIIYYPYSAPAALALDE